MDHYPETLCLKIAILGLTKMRERHEKGVDRTEENLFLLQ